MSGEFEFIERSKMDNIDNAMIRSWAKANGIEVKPNGNVPPQIVVAFMNAHAPKAEKPKAEKKPKAPKAEKPKNSPAIADEFSEHFSERTIQMVIRERGENAGDVLRTALAFMQNGMRSRYAAVNKAMAGETPRIAAETAAKPKATPKAKAKADSVPTAELGRITGWMLLLPSGAQLRFDTEAKAEKALAFSKDGGIVAPIIGG